MSMVAGTGALPLNSGIALDAKLVPARRELAEVHR